MSPVPRTMLKESLRKTTYFLCLANQIYFIMEPPDSNLGSICKEAFKKLVKGTGWNRISEECIYLPALSYSKSYPSLGVLK